MNDLFRTLLEQLRKSNRQTRTVIGAGLLAAVLIGAVSMWRSANPSMSLLYGNMDKVQFGKVASALAQGGVRFRDSGPHPPYTIWVADADRSLAMQAVHGEGALEGAPTGIQTGTGSAASAFLSQAEREQMAQKRQWEEAQAMLQAMSWIRTASLMTSPSRGGPFHNGQPATVSVMLDLDGVEFPDREQSQMVARIVRNCFGVPEENVVISDSRGRRIYDGSRDADLDGSLEFEQSFQRARSLAAQRFLDETFGPGLARASVTGEFSYEMVESLDESMDAGKFLVTEESSKSQTPVGGTITGVGGPATTSAGSVSGVGPASGRDEPLATTQESRKQYLPGRRTTYQRQTQPTLLRMTVSLVLDESLAGRLADAEEALKGVIGFNSERGDSIHSMVQRLPGVDRDEQGQPLPIDMPEPAPQGNPLVSLALERGIEILAAAVFLFLLLRTLRRSSTPLVQTESGNIVPKINEDEIDMDALARRHVEELLAREPEKVGALLSRWALGEDYFIKSSR